MMIIKLNLDHYNAAEIIQLHQDQIITLDEIIESGRAGTLFSSDLKDYVDTVRPERRNRKLHEEATIKIENKNLKEN